MNDINKSTYNYLRIGKIVPKGWMLEQLRRDLSGFVGNLDKLAEEAGKKIFFSSEESEKQKIQNMQKDSIHNWWDGESEGNWIDGLVRTAYLSENKSFIDKVNKYIKDILKYRDADGYIGVYPPNHRYLKENIDGELWTQSRIFLAMLAYYDICKDEDVLEAIKTAAKVTISSCKLKFKSIFEFNNLNALGHGLMIIEPMLQLYSITKDESYKDFAILCYEDYSSQDFLFSGGDDCKMNNLLDPDGLFKGHGVHTCEHLRIPLLLYNFTGIEKYKIAYLNAFKKIKNYLTTSGACKSDELVGMPTPTSGYEYCAITELLISFITIVQIAGLMEYADMAEKLLFNASEASRHYNGKALAYLSADNVLYATKKVKKMPPRWCYSPTHQNAAVCCNSNAGRLLPYFISKMWLIDSNKNLTAVFYGPCSMCTKIGETTVTIEEITNYPFENTIKFLIKIKNPTLFTLKFRIPKWATSYSVKINGNNIENKQNLLDFFVIKKIWEDGDIIDLNFETIIKTIQAIDNTVAVQRGPLVYALDIPSISKITKKYKLKDFVDIDYYPKKNSMKLWDYVLQIDNHENSGNNFLFQEIECNKNTFPWEKPPICIKTIAVDDNGSYDCICLIPIGCTTLRKTTFNYITGYKDKHRYYIRDEF